MHYQEQILTQDYTHDTMCGQHQPPMYIFIQTGFQTGVGINTTY